MNTDIVFCNPRKVLGEALAELGAADRRIVAVSCDSVNSGFQKFASLFPERLVECGIAEQNALSVCAGMACMGLIPFIGAINPFLTMRGYEQIRDDLGYSNANVKIIGTGSGLGYSTLGASHETLEDMALMRSIPNMTILCPWDGGSVQSAAKLAADIQGPVYIRMPIQPLPEKLCAGAAEPGAKAQLLRDGGDCAIFATGTMLREALDAARLLSRHGVEASVYNLSCVKPIDSEAVLAAARHFEHIFSVEEHSVYGGLGTAMAELLADAPRKAALHVIGVPENGVVVTGNYREVLDYYGLSAGGLAQCIASVVK